MQPSSPDRRRFTRAALSGGLLLATGQVSAQADQQALVTQAEAAFRNFLRDPEMGWFQQNIGRARAVLIAPEIVKAGFIIGGSGGRAVLLAKDSKSGQWRGPAFYTMATGSIGFQVGIQVAEMVTLVFTQKGIDSLLATSMKLGGDASVAAGPVGVGAKGEVVTDMVGFSRAKGLYGGLNLDGTVITVDDQASAAYYGKSASPADVLVRGAVSNKQAAGLIGAVRNARK